MHIAGTSFSATAPMRLMPPSTTAPVSSMSTAPVIQGSTPKALCIALEMPLAWTMLPMPKPASPPKTANAPASQPQRLPRPLRMAYIGPPACSPLSSTSRYFTATTTSAYLVAMPTNAVIHIQNSAPGPPTAIAVATPAMLPVPTVADSAVINAANGEISP